MNSHAPLPLIGLCGASGAGKDTIACVLVEQYGYVRLAVADHLKEVTKLAFGLTIDQLWGDARNDADQRWGQTPRELYQRLSDALRSIHPAAVTYSWRVALASATRPIVVPDVRMPEEAEVIRTCGGVLWRVHRTRNCLEGAAAMHHTELSNSRLVADRDVFNDSSLDSLRIQVRQLMEEPKSRSRNLPEGTP